MMSDLGKIDTSPDSVLRTFSALSHSVLRRFTVASVPARRGPDWTQHHVLWSKSTFSPSFFSLHTPLALVEKTPHSA